MASPDVTLPRPDLPQAPWVLAPGETAISRVPRYLAKSGKVQIRQVHALTISLPDTYPFAPEPALDRYGSKRYRISWFVITAPSGVRLTALLAGVGNVWIERTQDGGRVWICNWPGRWTEWSGESVRHPYLPRMKFYFTGTEWRWDDAQRISGHSLYRWRKGLTSLPEAALDILWGEDWRVHEDAREDRPLPTPAQTVKIWEVYQGLPCRLWGGVTRRIQVSRRKQVSRRNDGVVLQWVNVPAVPSAGEQSRQALSAPVIQPPSRYVDEDDTMEIQEVEQLLSVDDARSAEVEDEHENERQVESNATMSGSSRDKDVDLTEHEQFNALPSGPATSVVHLTEAVDHILQNNLRDAVSQFLYSVRADEGAANLRRGQQDDPIRLDVERDPEDEARRRFLQALDPVFHAFQASAQQSIQTSAPLSATAAMKMEE